MFECVCHVTLLYIKLSIYSAVHVCLAVASCHRFSVWFNTFLLPRSLNSTSSGPPLELLGGKLGRAEKPGNWRKKMRNAKSHNRHHALIVRNELDTWNELHLVRCIQLQFGAKMQFTLPTMDLQGQILVCMISPRSKRFMRAPCAQVAKSCVPCGTLRLRCDAKAPGINASGRTRWAISNLWQEMREIWVEHEQISFLKHFQTKGQRTSVALQFFYCTLSIIILQSSSNFDECECYRFSLMRQQTRAEPC